MIHSGYTERHTITLGYLIEEDEQLDWHIVMASCWLAHILAR